MTKRVSQYEFPTAKNLSRTRSPFMIPETAYQHLERGSTRKVSWSDPLASSHVDTGCVEIKFFSLLQGYSVVEQPRKLSGWSCFFSLLGLHEKGNARVAQW